MEVTPEALARFFAVALPHLNELQRRVVAGGAAEMLGRGGRTAVATASGMSRNTVTKAAAEVAAGIEPTLRLRVPGGGDRQLADKQPGLLLALDDLLRPEIGPDAVSMLRWTTKSSATLAEDLAGQGFEVSSRTVLRLLHRLGYSLPANARVGAGYRHPDREAQFRYANDMAATFTGDGQAAISVDTREKQLTGQRADDGAWPSVERESESESESESAGAVSGDLVDRARAKVARAVPARVYDLANDAGWVRVGDVADAAEFAVESVRRWWDQMGRSRFPDVDRLLIIADGGGPDGLRIRAWKVQLARLAIDTGLSITVCHHPPATSRWTRVEHRMFSFITMDRGDRHLTGLRTVVELIAATSTQAAPNVQAAHDPNWRPTGVNVSDAEMAAVTIVPHAFQGGWNYTISPPPDAAIVSPAG